MYAFITGASMGIGRDMAKILSEMGYDLIVVARSLDLLESLKNEVKTNVIIEAWDLSDVNKVIELHDKYKDYDIDVVINNAGFGDCDEFIHSSLEKEIKMINLNVEALHILTKLFLLDMVKKDKGYILNVSSIASFMVGPLMSTYYASKAYVTRLSQGIQYELKKMKSNVSLSILAPGPVDTNFNKNANVEFKAHGLNSYKVAKYTIKKMFKRKKVIVPGASIKLGKAFLNFIPLGIKNSFVYKFQKKKMKDI